MLQIKRQVCTLLLMLLIDGRAQLELLSCVLYDFRSNKYCKERSFRWHTSFNLANRGCSLNLFKHRLSISISTHTHTMLNANRFPRNGDRSGVREGRTKKENCYLLFAQIVIKYLKIMPRAQEEICKEQRRREAEMREIFIFMREKMKCKDFHRHAGFLDGFLNMHTEHQFYICVCVCVRVSREFRPITMLQHGGQ